MPQKQPAPVPLSAEQLRAFHFEPPHDSFHYSWSPKKAFDARDAGEVGSTFQGAERDTLHAYLTEPAYAGVAELSLLETSRRNLPKPDALMTVYRAVDKETGALDGAILPGAFVSESLRYAKEHADINQDGKSILLQTRVFPDELVSFGDPHEFVYVPRSLKVGHARYAADFAKFHDQARQR